MFGMLGLGLVTVVGLGSCRAPTESGAPTNGSNTVHTYELSISADASRPKVSVSLQVPASWSETLGADGAPSFASPGIASVVFGLTAVATADGEPAARLEQAFKWQYDDGAGVTRTPLSNGRLWASRVEARLTHARMFVPVAGGVAMGVAMLRAPTDAQLAEIRGVFETLAVAAKD